MLAAERPRNRERMTRPKRVTILLHENLDLGSVDRILDLSADMQRLDLSRRQVADWMADRIFAFEGNILNEDGSPFEVGDEAIDEAFNNDGSFRWLSDFLRATKERPRQRAQRRIHQRLKLIYIALCIEYCVVNAALRAESRTFFKLPEGVQIHDRKRSLDKFYEPARGMRGYWPRLRRAYWRWYFGRAWQRERRRQRGQ